MRVTSRQPENDLSEPSTAVGTVRPIGLRVLAIGPYSHAAFIEAHSASFLQSPDWAAVKPGWRSERLGWFDGDDLVGVAAVLYRPVPGTRMSLAYLPEGPVLPWASVGADLQRWLDPLVAQLRARHAFAVRIGPALPVRAWRPATAKRGLADPEITRFSQLAPDDVRLQGILLARKLRQSGWRPVDDGAAAGGFGAGQPKLGVRIDLRGKALPDLLAGANQQWRRNAGRSAKAGVSVRRGSLADLAVFHRLYRETAERDGFTPRPAGYFDGMWRALAHGGEPRIRLYLAELGAQREPLAAALMIRIGGCLWYAYGASSSRHRPAQASTAVQWRALQDAHAEGCHTYDLRGIADTLDPAQPLVGLLRFKLGMGGQVVETMGEWELTLSPTAHRLFRLYLRWRS